MSLRDVTIAQMGNGNSKCEWHHAPEARGRFGEFLKSQSWVETLLGRRRLTFAFSRWPWAGFARDERRRWKSQNRKNVYLSPYVEEPLNSKVVKSFVPEQKSRKCFSYFEIPMFYVYTYEHYMSISHIHIGLWYTTLDQSEPRSNGNESVLYTPQRTGASPSNAI